MTDRAKAALSSLAEKEAGAYAALCACAGCMLGLLEPDEAARRAQAAAAAPQTPAQQAALLCAAQYVREQMSRCDAALRSLPSVLETLAMSVSFPNAPGVLGALLRADIGTLTPSPPEDALFIPAALAADAAKNHALMPLAAPHTALRRVAAPPASPLAALALADAVLGRPFEALMLRSPISGPLMPLLSFVPLPHAHKALPIKRAG